MKVLSKNEVTKLIQEGKQLSEKMGTAILDHFEKNNQRCIKLFSENFLMK